MDWTSLLRVVVTVGTAGLALFAYRAARRERWPEPNLLVEELQCGDVEDDEGSERWPPAVPAGGERGFSFEHGVDASGGSSASSGVAEACSFHPEAQWELEEAR